MSGPSIDFKRLEGHQPGRVALLFSGGKDSRALIEIFRPYLGGIIVYHNDTGDMWPETVEYVAAAAKTLPHFYRIETNAPSWIETNGVPSPLLPVDCSPLMVAMDGNRRPPVVSPLECCAANRWHPITHRLRTDGITMIVHGQRASDYGSAGVVPWPLPEGMEEWPAINDWTDDQVFAYLDAHGVERARFPTRDGRQPPGSDCATCPAAWGRGPRAAHLRRHYPDLARRYYARLAAHVVDVTPHLRSLQHELETFEAVEPLARVE